MLVWLFIILVGSGAVAAGLLASLPRLKKKEAPPVEVAAKPLPSASKAPAKAATQSSDKKAPAESGDDKTKPFRKTASGSQKDGNADSAGPSPPPQALPSKPDEPLGIAANEQKKMVDEEPAGLLGDAPRKPEPLGVPGEPLGVPGEPLGVPGEPKLDIVDDTPKGLYAARTKPKTAEWLSERGGTIESQKAVEDGLDWLARHQGADGHWGPDCLGADPHSRCEKNAPCQGTGNAYEAAQTGLALLAFQAGGHYYFNGQKYTSQVTKGLDYLWRKQASDGSIVGSQTYAFKQIAWSGSMYQHAIATFALCEACAVAIAEGKKPDPRYQAAAQRAVSFIEKIQHDDGGWRYTTFRDEWSDTSVSGWMMLALKTAREAKLDVSPRTISRMMDFFASRYSEGLTYYQNELVPGTDALTGVGMMAVEFFEHKLDSPIVQRGAAYLADKAGAFSLLPRPGPSGAFITEMTGKAGTFVGFGDYYLWYNCTMAMFQVGGEPWKRWNSVIRESVISFQVQDDGCERGSWPPNDLWSKEGGRIYSTALAVLTLEVYYRFQRIAGQPENEKFARTGAQLPGTDNPVVGQAIDKFRAGDYGRALALVDGAIRIQPRDAAAQELRSLILFATTSYQVASITIHSVLDRSPGWDWTTLSSVYSDMQVYQSQLAALEKYVTLHPSKADARFLLAYHYMTAGHTDAAKEQLEQVVALVPSDKVAAKLLHMLGHAPVAAQPANAPSPAPSP